MPRDPTPATTHLGPFAPRRPLLAARALGLDRGAGGPVLEGIDLDLHAGEIVTLVGPNGAGKTSLVRLLLGLERPSRGSVTRRPGLRIGYVPQALDLDSTLPLTVGRFLRLFAGGATPAALAAALAEVGADGLWGRSLHALSGGERRRVLLARALAQAPDLLVLDEPLAGVDAAGQAALYDRIALEAARGRAALLVSHDLHLVMARTDRVLCINRHICCEGRPAAVRDHPEFLNLFGVYVHDGGHDHAHHDHAHHGHAHHSEPVGIGAPPA